ncbi:MAG: hypothetical protein IH907_03400 [Proteobacteria bacterium]|nr:hypothetical protein [Pseudomonadota bacterium]
MSRRVTTEKFVARAKAIHGDRYDYSLVEYVRTHDPVTIICSDHGIFAQRPSRHLRGSGCSHCGNLAIARNLRRTKADFIEKAKEVHGERYDYSQVEYVDGKTKVTIICPEHGPFSQEATSHLAKHGCPDCGGSKQNTTEAFIEKAKAIHGDRYDYSQVEYVNVHTQVTIVCPDHGPFQQVPASHLFQASGCPDCAGTKQLTTEAFIQKAKEVHGDRFDYSLVVYVNVSTNVMIICPDHGPFPQTPGVIIFTKRAVVRNVLEKLNSRLRSSLKGQRVSTAIGTTIRKSGIRATKRT